jgi:phosphoglycolate phosphatase
VPAFAHVAFDLDGTLVDSGSDLAAATNHVLRSFALPEIQPAVVSAYVGDGAQALVARALGPTSGERIDIGVDRFLAYYRGHLLDATRPYPGIEAMLGALRDQSVQLSVVTNKPEALCRAILDGLGLTEWFASIVGGDTLPTCKPDPAGLRQAMAFTGTTPGESLMVGDSPVDLATAAAAGTAFCGVGWGFVPERLCTCAPTVLVDAPAAVVALVKRGVGGSSGSTR